jgi:excisionase family DNA binding protein
MTTQDKLLTKKEVADKFGITTRTLNRWRNRGVIKAVVVGRVVRFRPDDVQAVIHRAVA